MLDYQRLLVYHKARELNLLVRKEIVSKADWEIKSQLKRACQSVILNIAEGSGRLTKPDKKRFYTFARGSLFETLSICDILYDDGLIKQEIYKKSCTLGEEISKMLYGIIKRLEE